MSDPQQSPYGPVEPNPYAVPAGTRRTVDVLGIVALCIGALALLIGLRSFSPFTIVLIVPAIVCGIIGLVEARRSGSSPVLSMLGVILALLPIVLFFVRGALGL